MPLTATDLPEPVVPATSRCGIFARSTPTGAPSMSLPSAIGSFDVAPAEAARPARISLRNTVSRVLFGTSMPTARLARDRRDDAHAQRLERHREVVREVGDLVDARAGRRRELVHRDDRTQVDLLHLAPHAVVRHGLLQPLGHVVERPACRMSCAWRREYSSRSVPGSWNAPSPSLMKPGPSRGARLPRR